MNNIFCFAENRERIGSEIRTLRAFKDNDCTVDDSLKNSWRQLIYTKSDGAERVKIL